MENVQIEAARIVTGGTRLTSIQKLYDETRWETLADRRKQHKLVLFYKMINNNTPLYLTNLVPNTVRHRHDHNTRQSNNILNINTRTSLYSEYFLPSVVKLWNALDQNIKSSESIAIFKRQIKSQNDKCPIYYYVGYRLGQILHTRLRLNCSSLNSHLFFKNIIYSPACVCGEIETTAHFFFNCPRYNNIRQEFLSSLVDIPLQISTDLLLYGSNQLTDEQNIFIFQATQSYIIKSKRFCG